MPTSSSSGPAWAAARPRGRWRSAGSTCWCSNAASGCRASPRTGRPRPCSSTGATSRPRRGRTVTVGRSGRGCTTSSVATPRCTGRRCRGSGSRTSRRWRTSRGCRRRGRSGTPTSSGTTARPSACMPCTAPPARTRRSRGAARPTRMPRCRTSRTSPRSPSGCGQPECGRRRRRSAWTGAPVGRACAVRRATGSRAASGPSRTPRCPRSTPRSRPGPRGWRPGCASSAW